LIFFALMIWINALFALLVLLLAGYAVLLFWYRKWFMRLQPFVVPLDFTAATRFTVIIPARNEEQNIGACVQSILHQDYPAHLFDIIVIDDHSTDNTAAVVRSLQATHTNLHLIRLEELLQGKPLNSYKKKAIELAIGQATGDWIVTTDADCFFNPGWLQGYAAYIQQYQPALVAAPVIFHCSGSFLSVFQSLDFMSLQGITAAAVSAGFHSMCNGANLAYNKKIFYEVGGFRGIDNIASGDDMLLMHKIKQRYPRQTAYLFSQQAIVETAPMPDWKSFFNQRIRWASKADKYSDKGIFWVLLLVYLLNFFLLVFFFVALFKPLLLVFWVGLLLAKTLIELSFMLPVARFFDQVKLLNWFAVMQPFHITYMVVAGWLGKFGKYQWKGRQVK
jgi:cellulose synthase/poly-beta-1,6-N-acetylglucosamine synthase-like glycosyltransferase